MKAMEGGGFVREHDAMAVLVSVTGLTYARREMALRAAGSALAILENPREFAAQLGEAGVAAVRRTMREGVRSLEDAGRQGMRWVVRGEEGYPPGLMQIAHPPHLLFIRGEANLLDPFPFAIVGTRRASDYGLRQTRKIACELAQAGLCIVSGLALGIDAAAHRGALEAEGRTIAVLGGGLNRMYPAQNEPLMREIVERGGSVVTEYPPDEKPARYNFLHRNRIIAGLSQGVLVTEGARRSGALRTVEDALACGREVFALPGRVDSIGSQLPHMLLAEGAHLATCAQDILDAFALGETGVREPVKPQTEPAMPRGLTGQEALVYRALEGGACDFDGLCQQTGIPGEELGAVLMMMDMDGVIEALPGLRYALL